MKTRFVRQDGSTFERDVDLHGAEIWKDGCGCETEWIHHKPINIWFRFDPKKSWENEIPTFTEDDYTAPIILTISDDCPRCSIDVTEREGDERCTCD